MQEFDYQLLDDGTYCVMKYRGDEPDVVIPDKCGEVPITVLYDDLFKDHPEITSVHIPDTVREMGEFLFDGCENLKHLKLPSRLESLWGYTFVRCGLEEITLPHHLTSLPPFAFKDCKNLKKVVCGAGMKKIYSWVFGGCDKLDEFICGPQVEISPKAFSSKELNS